MKYWNAKIFTIAALLALNITNAHSAVLIQNLTIRAVVAGWGGEGVYVDVNEAIGAQQTGFACSTTNRFYMPVNSPMYKDNVAMILSVYAIGAAVDFAVADCQLGAIRFVAIQLRK